MSILTASGDYQLTDQVVPSPVDINFWLGPYSVGAMPLVGTVNFYATIMSSGAQTITLHDWETDCNQVGCAIDRGFNNLGTFVLPDPSAILTVNFWSDGPTSSVALSYSIIPNGQNQLAPAVPEPSTWIMLLIGFIAIACTAKRRLRRFAVHPHHSL